MVAQAQKSVKKPKKQSAQIKWLVDVATEICDKLSDVSGADSFQINFDIVDIKENTGGLTIGNLIKDSLEIIVLFNRRYFRPKTADTMRLIAHELAHCYDIKMNEKKYINIYKKKKMFPSDEELHNKNWERLFKQTGHYGKYNVEKGGYDEDWD